MANITIKELIAADKISELIDKINFNFDQLLLNGGGPIGKTGNLGPIGPIGPRGTTFFTAADIYITENSPSWSGTPEPINDINTPGYPQYKGDPNKYLPVGLGSYPFNSFIIGYEGKELKNNDLYIQEGDDTFNNYQSSDGDIWIFDSNNSKWVYSGTNIKGDKGDAGTNSTAEWDRISDSNQDILHPKVVQGQNAPGLVVGVDNNYLDYYFPGSAATFMSSGGSQITIGNNSLHVAGDKIFMPIIGTNSDGSFTIIGSQNGTSNLVQIQAYDNRIILSAGGSSFINYSQEPSTVNTPRHLFSGGNLTVNSPNNNSTHTFENQNGNYIKLNIRDNTQVGFNSINTDFNKHLVLQDDESTDVVKNVGIGAFGNNNPGSKLSVAGNMVIGKSYKQTAAPNNSLLIEGRLGVGTRNVPDNTDIQTQGSISITDGFLGWNVYYDNSSYRVIQDGYPSFIKQEGESLNFNYGSEGSLQNSFGFTFINNAMKINNRFGYVGLNFQQISQPRERLHIHNTYTSPYGNGTILLTSGGDSSTGGASISYGAIPPSDYFIIRMRTDRPTAPKAKTFQLTFDSNNLSTSSKLGSSKDTPIWSKAFYKTGTSEYYMRTGINNTEPKADLTISSQFGQDANLHLGGGRDSSLDTPNGQSISINPYVGFGAYLNEEGTGVEFESHPYGGGVNEGGGVFIFSDSFGNLHFAVSKNTSFINNNFVGAEGSFPIFF